MTSLNDRSARSGGILLTFTILIGAVAGLYLHQPMIGLLAGLAIGLALVGLVWLIDRRR